MLVLTRKPGDEIRIGDDIRLVVVEIREGRVRLGIDAPKGVRVDRLEVWLKRQKDSDLEHRGKYLDARRQ